MRYATAVTVDFGVRNMKIWQRALIITGCLLMFLGLPMPAIAQDYAPPLSFSNAELRGRDFRGWEIRAAEFSNANLSEADFTGADARGAIFSASVARETNFHGVDFSTGMLDSTDFTRADLSDAVLVDTIMLRSTFDDADITGADFSGAMLDGVQVRKLCAIATGTNSQTGVATRDSLGCR
jgi:uncharacterized protein YjbI with pentapeptide repeats